MFENYTFTVVDRFLHYVTIDTQSNPNSTTHPSSQNQFNLSHELVNELHEMGINDAFCDEFGYVYATIPANTTKQVPTICFCSHVDTSPDCSGKHVKPILHKNYQGQDIVLPDDTSVVLSTKDMPYLLEQIGCDIITASGTTLLGADDKSGVAEIMDLAHFLMKHPNIKHGTIKLLFTPDEEIGKGTAKINLQTLAADYAYTLDGGELGTYEDETFSADLATVTIQGVMVHPGYAKNILINALKIASEIIAQLPKNNWSPETTSGREGFVHPVSIEGTAEVCKLQWIIRDFNTDTLKQQGERLQEIVYAVCNQYKGVTVEFNIQEQYRNMYEVINKYPFLEEYTKASYARAGIRFVKEPVRGGTDGSRLSFMGLPCPNIFTGMQAIHSKKEWIGVRDMKKAVEVLVHLVQIWEENAY